MSENIIDKNRFRSSSDKICIAIVLLTVVVHFAFLGKYFEPSIYAIDSHGYYGQAKEIATTVMPYKVPVSDIEFLGYTWHEGKDGRYFTMWPPGFPAMIAVVYKTMGPLAGMYLNPVLASLTLLGLFLLCRAWVGSPWGVMAVILYAVNPVANQFSLMGYSHTSGTFFLVWGIYFFSRWMETHSGKLALASGLALGIISSIRTPEIIITACVVLFALVHFRIKEDEDSNGLGYFLLGVAIPVLILFTFNHFMFGSFMSNGYSLIGYKVKNIFRLSVFINNFISYFQKLLAESGGFPFVLGTMGIIHLLSNSKFRRFGILISLIILPITLMYISYNVAPNPLAMRRLLLPTIPFYAISAVWFIKLITENNRSAAVALSSALILLTVVWGVSLSSREMKSLKRKTSVLKNITEELKKNVEPGSILIADEIVCQNLDYFNYWKLVDISSLTIKKPDVFAKKGGYEFFSIFEKDLRSYSGGKKIYWLGRKNQIHNYMRYSKTKQHINTVATISVRRLKQEYNDDDNMRRGGNATEARRTSSVNPINQSPNIRMERLLEKLANGKSLELYEWVLE